MNAARAGWSDVGQAQRGFADATAPDIRPMLLGYRGSQSAVQIVLRSFPAGEHHKPIVEGMGLVIQMGCDRLSLALPGRAWCADGPAPVVGPAVDPRQRVLVETRVIRRRGEVTTTCVLHPFALDEGLVRWDLPTEMPDGEGWTRDALELIMGNAGRLRNEATSPAAVMVRLGVLGHQVHVTPHCHDRLMRDPLAT